MPYFHIFCIFFLNFVPLTQYECTALFELCADFPHGLRQTNTLLVKKLTRSFGIDVSTSRGSWGGTLVRVGVCLFVCTCLRDEALLVKRLASARKLDLRIFILTAYNRRIVVY